MTETHTLPLPGGAATEGGRYGIPAGGLALGRLILRGRMFRVAWMRDGG